MSHHTYYKCSVCHKEIGEWGDPEIIGVLYPTITPPTEFMPIPSSGYEAYCFEHDPYAEKFKRLGTLIKKKEELMKKEVTSLSDLGFDKDDREIKEQCEALLKFYKDYRGWDLVFENGYLRFFRSILDSSKKGEFLHIWIFEKVNGRKVKAGFILHHKDFNKLNNKISNLEEITPEEHREKHLNRKNG